jgi:predicted RNA binding protein YcfA (HicA-like mRNA interferase family)
MPKLPVVSGKDTINALEHLGFTVTRQKGSHVVLRNCQGDGRLCDKQAYFIKKGT